MNFKKRTCSLASPTTPSRRAAGMLDFESPIKSPSFKSPPPLTEEQLPTTPSLLSRLFSWGTPLSAGSQKQRDLVKSLI